jgi:drug/metabolite transporter (DMT)-like permease
MNRFAGSQYASSSVIGKRVGAMTKYIPFILFTVMTNAAAQLLLKYGMISLGPISFTTDTIIQRIFQIVFNPWVFCGLAVFVISMASHLYVLSKVDLSFAYPFLSLAYVAVAVFAWAVFKEDLGALKIAGIAFICVGTVLIAQSGHSRQSTSHEVARAETH